MTSLTIHPHSSSTIFKINPSLALIQLCLHKISFHLRLIKCIFTEPKKPFRKLLSFFFTFSPLPTLKKKRQRKKFLDNVKVNEGQCFFSCKTSHDVYIRPSRMPGSRRKMFCLHSNHFVAT